MNEIKKTDHFYLVDGSGYILGLTMRYLPYQGKVMACQLVQ